MKVLTDIGYVTAVDELANIDIALNDMFIDLDTISSDLRKDAKECTRLGINNQFMQIRVKALKLHDELYQFKKNFEKLNVLIIAQCAEVQQTKLK